MAQVRIVSVPYQGGTQAISDVIGGTASLVFQSEALSISARDSCVPSA